MSGKKRPGKKRPGLPKGTDTSYVFDGVIRFRQRGNPRSGTKSKAQLAQRERDLQKELASIRGTSIPDLPKANKLPESQIFKAPKKRSRFDVLKDRILGRKSTTT